VALSRGSRWFLATAVLVLAGVAGGLWWLDERIFVESIEAGQDVEYEVQRGQSVRAVGDDLAELGVVSSSVRFRLAAEEAQLPATLQPGSFELETGMTIDDAIEVLAAGPVSPPTIRWTVPEGLTVEQTLPQIAEAFPDLEVADLRQVLDERTAAGQDGPDVLDLPDWVQDPSERGDIVVDPYEGLLWPQTYEIDEDATPLEVLQRMVDQVEREFDALEPAQLAQAEEQGLDRYTLLVVASLIERETRVDAERSTVAGVIANRLEEGMRLQIDATVVYALGGGPTDLVTFEDLEVESPYNTYQVDGLPPTPISGVGSAALAAALDPADVPYRFYVLAPECDGSHRFAETGEEHQENVEAFQAADRCL
jgi:UPF0755 protein